jgi:integrase
LKYHRNGAPVYESTGTTDKRQAEKLLQRRLGELAVGTFIEPSDRKITVDELYEGYLDNYRINQKASLQGAEQRWQRQPKEGQPMPPAGRLKKYFGGMLALAVTTDILNKYILYCRDLGKSNATINRDFAALKRAFNLGKKASKIHVVPEFPEKLEEAPPRDGFLEWEDYVKLKQHVHVDELWLRTLVTFVGLPVRRGELIGDPRKGYQDALRVRHVDLLHRLIRLKLTKNGKDRIIPIRQELYPLIAASISGKKKDDFVFTRKNGKQVKDFRGRWERLFIDAGLERKLVHDTRRSAARNFRNAGIDEGTVMKLGGWKGRSVFDRYNIHNENDLHKAGKQMDDAERVWGKFGESSDQLHQNRAAVEIEKDDVTPEDPVQ